MPRRNLPMRTQGDVCEDVHHVLWGSVITRSNLRVSQQGDGSEVCESNIQRFQRIKGISMCQHQQILQTYFWRKKKKKKQASRGNVTHYLRSLLTTQRFGKHKAIFCVSIAANVCMKLRKQRKSSKSLRRSPQPWRGCQKGPQLYLWGQALCDILCIFQMFLTDTKMCYRNLSRYYLSSSLY